MVVVAPAGVQVDRHPPRPRERVEEVGHQAGGEAAHPLAAQRQQHRRRSRGHPDRRWRGRAPRPAAPGHRRSARSRPARRAPRSSAWPSTIATSSTVWCSSTQRSPVHCRSMSISEWKASAVSMWSRKPMPVVTRACAGCRRAAPRSRSASRGCCARTWALRPAAAGPVRAGAPRRPAPPAHGSLSSGPASVIRRWLGSASNVRTTIPSPSSARHRGVVRRAQVAEQEVGARLGDRPAQAAAAPAASAPARPRSRPPSAASRRGSARAISASAAECEEMLPGGRIASSTARQRGRRQDVADPGRGEPEGLRERAHDHGVLALAHELREVGAAELDVGLIDHDQTPVAAPARPAGGPRRWGCGACRSSAGGRPSGSSASTPPASRVALSNMP